MKPTGYQPNQQPGTPTDEERTRWYHWVLALLLTGPIGIAVLAFCGVQHWKIFAAVVAVVLGLISIMVLISS